MTAAITASSLTPAVGSAVAISVSGVPSNTSVGYDPTKYPASPAVLYYISVNRVGHDSLVSQQFSPDEVNGAFVWPGVVIPSAGTWVAQCRKVADNVSVANVNIVAS